MTKEEMEQFVKRIEWEQHLKATGVVEHYLTMLWRHHLMAHHPLCGRQAVALDYENDPPTC